MTSNRTNISLPTWTSYETEEIIVDCPHCGKRTAPPPPEDSFCSHVMFIYLYSPADEDGFIYLRDDVECSLNSFIKRLESHENYNENDAGPTGEIYVMALKAFVEVKTYDHFASIQSRFEKLKGLRVLDITESVGFYPGRVIVGFALSRLA